MDQLARDYADDVHFLFVYTREIHPDDFPDYPPHQSIEQKYQHARDMQRRHNTPRQILIDSLDGDVHRQWGGLPNMSWIIDHTGTVAYKAGWTLESDIRPALEDVMRIREFKRQAQAEGRFYKDYFRESITVLPSGRSPYVAPELATSEAHSDD